MVQKLRGRGHHHGNAREALLMSAHGLLEDVGAAGLSLRQLSERAGLSRQAAYNHFEDKQALLAALVMSGFQRLAREVRGASASHTGRPALAAAAETYIAFAQGSPALFRLMFVREFVDLSRYPEAAASAAEAFRALVAVVATITDEGRVEGLSLAAWCLVHGYATLANEAAIDAPERRRERADFFAGIICAPADAEDSATSP